MALGVVVAPVLILLLFAGPVWASDQNLPRICIEDGCMIGTWMKSVRNEWFEAFFGIPFAKPPVGELRFANPVPNDRWAKKQLDATGRFPKPPCVQVDLFTNGIGVEGNEDCLYLNVYRPIPARKNPVTNNATASPKLPTVVYIHGGGYFSGTNSPLILGPEKLMVHPVILVTIAYRVGLLGFFSTGDEAASGNFGLKDQRLALRWVHRNIRIFGGDPRLVTIMGQSAGGSSVQLQMMHLGNEGLFQRAISLSGSALAPWSTPQGNLERLARLQATIAGIKDANTMSTSKLVKALRAIDAKRLASSIAGFTNGSLFPVFVYGPTVEKTTVKDAFLTATPQELWSLGAYLPVPWLTGILPNDGSALSAPFLNLTTRTSGAETSIQLDALLLYIMRGTNNPNAVPLLKERFFSNASSFGGYLTKENIGSLTKLFNEGAFYYPMALSVKQQFQHKKGSSTSSPATYVYKFNYKGQFSYSSFFATGYNSTLSQDFGIVHSDDTIYIFRTPALFPDFQRGSPDAQASQRFTKFLVDFARTGYADELLRSSNARDGFPLAIEFFNKENKQDPLGLRLTYIYDKDILNFWTTIYSS
uniref:Carboxylic ester hydrolase n=1 Tax=Anopheles atroparvus TaxID=41427 RepID=A0AAG5DGB8_ANOAO